MFFSFKFPFPSNTSNGFIYTVEALKNLVMNTKLPIPVYDSNDEKTRKKIGFVKKLSFSEEFEDYEKDYLFRLEQDDLSIKFKEQEIKQKKLIREYYEMCQCCHENEATEQLPNESGLYVCYGCKVAQREVFQE